MTVCVRFAGGHIFHFSRIYTLGVELLNQMITLRLAFEEVPDCFPKWSHNFTFLSAVHAGTNFPIFLTTLVILCLFDPEGVKWYFLVVFICISLTATHFENVFMSTLANRIYVAHAYWPFGVNGIEVCDEIQQNRGGIRYRNDILSFFFFLMFASTVNDLRNL